MFAPFVCFQRPNTCGSYFQAVELSSVFSISWTYLCFFSMLQSSSFQHTLDKILTELFLFCASFVRLFFWLLDAVGWPHRPYRNFISRKYWNRAAPLRSRCWHKHNGQWGASLWSIFQASIPIAPLRTLLLFSLSVSAGTEFDLPVLRRTSLRSCMPPKWALQLLLSSYFKQALTLIWKMRYS
jgi:hypothetical protein